MPDWMIAVFSIVSCWVYGVKIAGTITSAIVVETLVMALSSNGMGRRALPIPMESMAKLVFARRRAMRMPQQIVSQDYSNKLWLTTGNYTRAFQLREIAENIL